MERVFFWNLARILPLERCYRYRRICDETEIGRLFTQKRVHFIEKYLEWGEQRHGRRSIINTRRIRQVTGGARRPQIRET
ncbi:hypothetical protein D3C77_565350 [compost metagenome]